MSNELDGNLRADDQDVAPKPFSVRQAATKESEDIKVAEMDANRIKAADFWATPVDAPKEAHPQSQVFQTKNNQAQAVHLGSTQAQGPTRADTSPCLAAKGLEQMGLAFIDEQRRARRWKIFFRFVWAGLLIWFVYRISSDTPVTGAALSQAHTAVVSIEDTIASDSMASSHYVIPALKSAFESSSAKAVVLLINSPGGSPVQAGIIYDEIKRLKTKHKKPVYAVVQESATSAAYYIAVAADDIYVNKASIVGSIGVLMDGFGATELMKKVGLERRLLTAGERKGILDPFSPQSQADVDHAHKLLDQIHQQFIAVVREGRKGRLKENADTFSGLFWTGEDAIAQGLADKLGDIDYVAREVVKAEELVDYSYEEGVAERLVKRFGAAVGQALVQSATPSVKVQ